MKIYLLITCVLFGCSSKVHLYSNIDLTEKPIIRPTIKVSANESSLKPDLLSKEKYWQSVEIEHNSLALWIADDERERVKKLKIQSGELVFNGRTLWMNFDEIGLPGLRDLDGSTGINIFFKDGLDHPEIIKSLNSIGNLGISFPAVPISMFNLPKPVPKLPAIDSLRALDIHFSLVQNHQLAEISKFDNLQYLNLRGTFIRGLEHLENLVSLKTLDLYGTNTGDKGLARLTKLTNLENLHVGVKTTDEGLSLFSQRKNLRVLDLFGAPITNDGLAAISGLTKLRYLNLHKTQITNKGLVHLSGLTSLQTLNLKETKITDEGLAHLSDLISLRTLDLSQLKVNGKGFVHFSNLTALDSLILRESEVTDAGIANLSRLSSLHSLYLNQTKITDKALSQLPLNLLHLYLKSTSITDKGMTYLPQLKALKSLDLNKTKITDAGLKTLSRLKALDFLDLGQTKITGKGLSHLTGLKVLNTLGLHGVKAVNIGLIHLPRRLKNLDLSGSDVDDNGLKHLTNLPLRQLTLQKTKITDVGLNHLAKIHTLEILDIRVTDISKHWRNIFPTPTSLRTVCVKTFKKLGITNHCIQP